MEPPGEPPCWFFSCWVSALSRASSAAICSCLLTPFLGLQLLAFFPVSFAPVVDCVVVPEVVVDVVPLVVEGHFVVLAVLCEDTVSGVVCGTT